MTIKTSLSIFFLSLLTAVSATENTVSTIKSVTVFRNGAQINRAASKNISKGISEIKLGNLSSTIDPNSIQVKGLGNFTILSVSHELNYLTEQASNPRIKELNDSLKFIDRKLKLHGKLLEAYKEEKAVLQANKTLQLNERSIYTEELEEAITFLKNQMSEVLLKTLEVETLNEELNANKNRIKRQLNTLNSNGKKPTGEITIEVSAAANTSANVEVDYLVRSAGWMPNYDLRAKDTKSKIEVNYKAQVWQSTGVDWNKVDLKLSTGNPNRNGNKPTLTPWRLNFQIYNYGGGGKKDYSKSNRAYPMAMEQAEGDYDDKLPKRKSAASIADFTQQSQNELNVVFDIQVPYNIKSGNKKHSVDIDKLELPTTYNHYCAPKYDTDVFLLARINGWDEYNILPGQANIYFDGTYIGKSYINTQITNDTLDISLGRDKSIIATREKIKDFTATKVIGSSKKEMMGMQLSFKNTGNNPVEIDVQDQIPVSGNKDIEVELIESTSAKHEINTGYLSWKLKLAPSQSQKLIFKYNVKYPKAKQINF